MKNCPFCGEQPVIEDHSRPTYTCFRIDHWCRDDFSQPFIAVEADTREEVQRLWDRRST